MSDIPTPTIGRIVLVPVQTKRSLGDCNPPVDGPIEIRPAIVVRVFGVIDQNTGMPLINVRVFTDGANDGKIDDWKTSLSYSQEDHRVGTWHWMPYQLQTAGTRHQDAPAKVDSPTVPQSGPRITKEQIDRLLAESTWSDLKIGAKTTVVCLTMPNGFEVIESSGCVDPANYDHGMGMEICKKRITDKVWMLEGYRLACELAKS